MSESHIKWAVSYLNSTGYQIRSSSPDVIQDNPWSTVYRFETNKGFVFLKTMPKKLSIEAEIIAILRKKFNAPVPRIIASDQDLCCFLMQDAGIKLHDYFKENFQSKIFIKAMQDYAVLQMSTHNKTQIFLDMGVPDWRLEKLPELYANFIAHDELLLEDGLSSEELIKLKKLEPKFVSICEKIANFKIADTFGHADFHDKNILVDPSTNETTLIDLGEVVITHPFFSLHNCLYMAKENFSLSNEQDQMIRYESLKPWLAWETQENLLEVMSLISQCWSIHAVLAELRLMNSVNQSAFESLHRQGRLARKLRFWFN